MHIPSGSGLVSRALRRLIASSLFVGVGWLGAQTPPSMEEALGPQVEGLRPLAAPRGSLYRLERRIERRGAGWVVHTPKGDFEYPAIASYSVSEDGRRLVVMVRRKQLFLVEDGQEVGPFDDLSEVLFSPDGRRMAFYAKKGKAWRMVLDGVEGPEFPGQPHGDVAYQSFLLDRHMAFSGDGKHFAFVRYLGPGREQLVVDGQAWPECQDLWKSPIVFSDDGLHCMVVGRMPGWLDQKGVLLDGKEIGRFARVDTYRFQPGSSKPAVLGIALGGRAFASLGLEVPSLTESGRLFRGVQSQEGLLGVGTRGPLFSKDGAHFAYSFGDGDQVDVYVDGRNVLFRKESQSAGLSFSEDGRRLSIQVRKKHESTIVDLFLGPEPASGRWTILRRRELLAEKAEPPMFLSPDGKHLAYLARGKVGKNMEYWLILDGQEGPHYTFIDLPPRWAGTDKLVYFAKRGESVFRVTQRIPATESWIEVGK